MTGMRIPCEFMLGLVVCGASLPACDAPSELEPQLSKTTISRQGTVCHPFTVMSHGGVDSFSVLRPDVVEVQIVWGGVRIHCQKEGGAVVNIFNGADTTVVSVTCDHTQGRGS